MRMPAPRTPYRKTCFCPDKTLLFRNKTPARLNTNKIMPILIKAGYFPQSTACAGMYQPKAERTTANIPAQSDLVTYLTTKNEGIGKNARNT
jgi:hypothetical protein